jgi:hypothetical protein
MFTFEGQDQEIYKLVQLHFTQSTGCKNVILNLMIPSRKANLQKQVNQMVALSPPLDKDTVKETLNGVLLISLGATTFDQVQERMAEGFQKGLKGRPANNAVTKVARFSLIAAKALWDLRHQN